ncbi:hypothetical protein HBI74_036000 [Parastagonospora nodorum]|nr:hypothetical protein HBI74_036000 [Parastagonospora nodorum]
MLLSRLQRVSWPLACLWFATCATAAIAPSNSSTAGDFPGTLALERTDGDQTQLVALVPLTGQASGGTVNGNLVKTDFNNAANLSMVDVAYISCDSEDYTGFDDAQRVFKDAYEANARAVVLYSTRSDYCAYASQNSQEMIQSLYIYSMTSKDNSKSLLGLLGNTTLSVEVEGRGGANTNTGGAMDQRNPLGPSPSTAVAMIILYSITGIITALFLVIIITGAIRAHRHPERYGPRNVLGRPRQSRARGLGRAILDTIPIVKFGEKEPAKPTDVELASTAESSRGPEAAGAQTTTGANNVSTTPETAEPAEAMREVPTAPVEEQQEGIAPAQPVMTGAGASKDSSSHDENLGCSICTEDFEKGQDLRVLPCDHKFHPECVDPWLLNVSGTCPLCRVDLRPVTSNSSTPDSDADPTPEAAAAEQPHRSAFRDILSLRHRPNATPQERIYYLRRLREQRRNRSGDVAEQQEDTNDRRRSRMGVRLSGVFGGRARRERSPQVEESTQSGVTQREGSPATNGAAERRA